MRWRVQVDTQGNTQRVATVLMFLSEVEEGGETVFPLKSTWADPEAKKASASFSAVRQGLLRLAAYRPLTPLAQCAKRGPAIKPRTGDAILFWDMSLVGKEDESSMHASCPVIKGEKWTATKWCALLPTPCHACAEPARAQDAHEQVQRTAGGHSEHVR